MKRLLALALVLAASNAFAAVPEQIGDGEVFIPACYPLGMTFEPHCSLGGDYLN